MTLDVILVTVLTTALAGVGTNELAEKLQKFKNRFSRWLDARPRWAKRLLVPLVAVAVVLALNFALGFVRKHFPGLPESQLADWATVVLGSVLAFVFHSQNKKGAP